MLIFLSTAQVFAFNGSAGQGAFLLFHINKPLNPIKRPEIKNNIPLYLDNIIKNGKLDNNPTKTAPAPNATNNVGNAQHRRVPKLVKRLNEGSIKFLNDIGFILNTFIYFFNSITGIFK